MWPALRTHASHARRHGGAVGGGRRGRAAACSRCNGPAGHRSGYLGSARRRPRGGLAAAWSPAGAASELARVRRGIGARLVQGTAGRGRVSEGWYVVICMHMHGACGMCVPERTSLGRPQRAVERLVTAAAGAAAHPSSPVVEPLRLATMAASVGPPGRVRVGRWVCTAAYLQRS